MPRCASKKMARGLEYSRELKISRVILQLYSFGALGRGQLPYGWNKFGMGAKGIEP